MLHARAAESAAEHSPSSRNSPRVGRTLIQRWWGEAVVAKVRLYVPVDYFLVADDPPAAAVESPVELEYPRLTVLIGLGAGKRLLVVSQ
jgi:hypothetical protein